MSRLPDERQSIGFEFSERMLTAAPPEPPRTVPPDLADDATVVVLLIDDQPIVGHAVKTMLAAESDIRFHFCHEPLKAMELAAQLAPTVILQDLVMPEIDGLTLLKFFRANPATREIPMIVLSSKEEPVVKAQAFALGANDYLVKLPDRVELIARIRHHSRGYVAHLQRNEAYRKLAESERQLAQEVAEAAKYVRSLLPETLTEGPVRIDWRFVPSTQLGGDAFGYHWLDDRHMAVYLLDVSGHGVGSSLLAVSVLNVLTHRTLPNTDFYDPSAVMAALNGVFRMDRHGGHFFTIWYGVFAVDGRRLTYSGGGHPPAVLFGGADAGSATIRSLEGPGPPIGVTDLLPFENAAIDLPAFARLLLYRDGAVEVGDPDGDVLTQDDFDAFVAETGPADDLIDRVLDRARRLRGNDALNDDCSVMRVDFL
jgi:sigma-B regulation protein RsbU (phosphoserine phosphatase)